MKLQISVNDYILKVYTEYYNQFSRPSIEYESVVS